MAVEAGEDQCSRARSREQEIAGRKPAQQWSNGLCPEGSGPLTRSPGSSRDQRQELNPNSTTKVRLELRLLNQMIHFPQEPPCLSASHDGSADSEDSGMESSIPCAKPCPKHSQPSERNLLH
ncbi:hypothetical protein P7K49_024633 [Saguinus oedipus]|uniref:Uncharacterized protein n=1 Tax=Saguinus oedipus TaxID=9490 RepID=A0ABQ9UQ21_SAGOE|nr:hypothetical protein P7K49_024633 [Saguinus oedipus]